MFLLVKEITLELEHSLPIISGLPEKRSETLIRQTKPASAIERV